jgi:glycosyltransferase involved in cell wall biosynthesis
VTVAVVVPVYGNEATLIALYDRLAAALAGRPWRLRLVIDSSPDQSSSVAALLAAADDRVAVTVLDVNVGQHRALEIGLAAEPDALGWVCLDADLQDPPEAVVLLLDRLAQGDVRAVFAGRRGTYENLLRRLTGQLHRALLARLTGLPADAGAFLALDARARRVVLAARAPSLVAAIGASRLPTTSVPVERAPREQGRTAWTMRRRVGQSARTLLWAARRR